jgi:hypothetical protein
MSQNNIPLVAFTAAEGKQVMGRLFDDSLIAGANELIDPGLNLFVITIPDGNGRSLPTTRLRDDEKIRHGAARVASELFGRPMQLRLRALPVFDEPRRGQGERELAFPHWTFIPFREVAKILGGKERIGLELVSSGGTLFDFEQRLGNLDQFDGVSRFGLREAPRSGAKEFHKKVLSNQLGHRILQDDHDDMVFYAWRELRHVFDGRLDPFKVLGINPLDSSFRLSQLQEFVEVCRGERLQRDQFRRAMLAADSYIKASGQYDTSKPGKPAELFAPIDDGDFTL